MGRWIVFTFLLFPLPLQSMRAASPLVISYELTGSFARNAERAGLSWTRPHEGMDAFDSFGGNDANTGTLRTAPFQAPAVLHLFVAGFPSLPGMRIYLLDENRNRSIDLTNRVDPSNTWKMHFWEIPNDWRGIPVRLIAEDNGTTANAWLGVTLPEAGAQGALVSFERAAWRNGLVVLLGLMFLLPGLAGCALLSITEIKFDLKRAVLAVMVISSFSALCIFAIYLAGPMGARKASLLLMAGSLVVVAVFRNRLFPGQTELRLELMACLGAVLLAGVFNCSVGNLYTTDDETGEYAQVRYGPGMPPDNLLPEMFAERLYNGQSVRPTLFGYWHSSDRPPLETAIMLMEMRMFPSHQDLLGYQSLGIFLQCTWVAGVWVLLRTARVKLRYIAFCLAACLFSFFCLFNTFYVWAKLLSTAFCLLGLSFFPFVQYSSGGQKSWTSLDGILVGSAFALGMLCHPGVAFTIAGVLLVASFSRSLPPLRVSGIALLSLLAFLLPWQAYQRFYDPPGDNLMKAHLAGVVDFTRPLGVCIVTAYQKLTLHQWALNKWANVTALFYGEHGVRLLPWDKNRILKEFLSTTFYYLSFTVGFLNAGLLTRFSRRGQAVVDRLGGRFLVIAAVSLALWCLVMFEPGSTVVHQGSYATVLLLFVGLALWLVNGAPKLAVMLLGIQIVCVFPIFVFARPLFNKAGTIGDGPLDGVMAAIAIASLAGFCWLFRRLDRVTVQI